LLVDQNHKEWGNRIGPVARFDKRDEHLPGDQESKVAAKHGEVAPRPPGDQPLEQRNFKGVPSDLQEEVHGRHL
jgi:hypothetical protein